MKRKFIVPVRYVLILFLLPVSACHKFIDWKDVWHKNKPDCRIEKIVTPNPFGDEPTIALFSYNHKGDPVTVEFNNPGTGRPHERFLYDNKGRLSAYFGPYNLGASGNYEFYHQFYYDNKNRVVLDSLYGFGVVVNHIPQPNPLIKGWAKYEYDAYDRISKIDRTYSVFGNQSFLLEEFFYNEDGNLAKYLRTGAGGPDETIFVGYFARGRVNTRFWRLSLFLSKGFYNDYQKRHFGS